LKIEQPQGIRRNCEAQEHCGGTGSTADDAEADGLERNWPVSRIGDEAAQACAWAGGAARA